MKLLLNLFFILISFFSYSKNDELKIELTPNGIAPIVVTTDNIKANVLYTRATNWIKENYINPDVVLKIKIENEKVRLSGFKKDACNFVNTGELVKYNLEYTIEISFKDGKYKFVFIINKFSRIDNTKTVPYTSFFTKYGTVRKSYKNAVPSLEKSINDILQSFNNYILGNYEKSLKDW